MVTICRVIAMRISTLLLQIFTEKVITEFGSRQIGVIHQRNGLHTIWQKIKKTVQKTNWVEKKKIC